MTTYFDVDFWGKIMFTRSIFVSGTFDLFDVF